MALCALGLIISDATLAGAALGELMKRGNGEIKQRGLKEKNLAHISNYVGSSKSRQSLRVDFHCPVIFTCVRAQIT